MQSTRHPHYFMAKPPHAVASHIAALPRTSRDRAPDLLHITLLPLGDRSALAPQLLPRMIQIGDSIEADPFRVVFDQIVQSSRTLALRGSETMRGPKVFQAGLVKALARHGLSIEPRYRFVPHVTIDYCIDGLGSEPIDPISWLVEEFLLVESVVGESRHIEHGRWALQGKR